MVKSVKFLAVLLAAILAALVQISNGQGASSYDAPTDCDWQFLDEESGFSGGVSLTCHLSAINSNTEKTNFSVIPAEGTRRLTVKCSEIDRLSSLEAGGFAGLSFLEELVLDSCRIEHVPALAFEGLARLKKLVIKTKQTGSSLSMAGEALSGLTNLETLVLAGNGLRSLPPEELCYLPSLTSLDLSGNQLGSEADLGLSASNCKLLRLQHLDLSSNEITTVHSQMLSQRWPQLKSLSLDSNFIRHVEDIDLGPGYDKDKCSLTNLNLNNNQINILPAALLQKCSDLERLGLANNSLSGLDGGFFDNLKRLSVLDMSGNRLASLDGRLTRDLVSLSDLDLSGNQLSILTASSRIFEAAASTLVKLNLKDNHIKTIEAKVFEPLANLKELDMSVNELAQLDSDTLTGMGRLTHLDLASNDLNNIHEAAFDSVPEVLVLDLSHNKLRSAPRALKSLSRLQTLDLGFNQISNIKGASFLDLSTLWRLQLNGNRISNLTSGLFHKLDSLQILDLSNNILRSIEAGTFDANVKLQALRLDSNGLTSIEELFTGLSNLMWLNVSTNAIVNFDYILLPVSLRWLDISHNLIKELGNYFDLNTELALRELDVSFNQLTTLGPHSIPDSIETLFVNDNRISEIVPYTFFKKGALLKVDLTVNNLKRIDPNALRLAGDINRLPDFYLTGNPIECDCEMVWFKSINSGSGSNLQTTYPIVKDIESIYCRLVYTRTQTFVPLVEAKNEQFLCPYETHCFALCQCCDFDACDCEMTCPDNCTCYHDASWSKNIAECSSSGFYDLPDQLPMDATEVFLDGNIFPELDSHTFIGRKNLQALHLNNSGIHTIRNKTFNGLKSLQILHLESNQLTQLQGFEFETLANLRELYLENNLLEYVHNSTFKFLRSLEVLHLDGNRLIDFPAWMMAFNPMLVTVKLAENLWSCECDFVQRFRAWMSVYGGKVADAKEIQCVTNDAEADNGEVTMLAAAPLTGAICIDSSLSKKPTATTRVQELVGEDYMPLLAATLSTFAFVLVILLACFVYRHSLRVWLHSKYGVRVFDDLEKAGTGSASNNNGSSDNGGQNNHQLLFDAFVSYSPKDEPFVRESLSSALERPAASYRLCLHHRDIPASTNQAYMADTIVRAAEASKRTIIVLSDNFLKSEWSRFDYKSGIHSAFRNGSKKIIFVQMDALTSREVDPNLRLYMKTNIVLKWSDKQFWEKLRYSLPDVNKKQQQQQQHQLTSGQSSVVSSTTSVLSSNGNQSPVSQQYAPAQQFIQQHAGQQQQHQHQQALSLGIYHQHQMSQLSQHSLQHQQPPNQHYGTLAAQHIYQQPRYATSAGRPSPAPSSVVLNHYNMPGPQTQHQYSSANIYGVSAAVAQMSPNSAMHI